MGEHTRFDGWALDPAVRHLNHGSYGAVRRRTLERQDALRRRIEGGPMRYYALAWQDELDQARARVAAEVGARADNLVFVGNASAGTATALASAALHAGDDVVINDHTYRACRLQVDKLAAERGLGVVRATLPVRGADGAPADPRARAAAIIAAFTPRTRLVVVDHVTSPTALVVDVAAVVAAAHAAGIAVLVDGAHGPGQLALELDALGADYYVGNGHKWWCGPHGVGFLWVADRHLDRVVPLVTSHGADPRVGPSHRFFARHDWTGTSDVTAALTLPDAIADVAAEVAPWPVLRARARALVHEAAALVGPALGATPLVDAAGSAWMVALPLALRGAAAGAALERQLLVDGWEVAIPMLGERVLLRLSAHAYNHLDDYGALVAHLRRLGVRGDGDLR
ncbi:MAG: aminotransferase class V-fold PLP-dependent enzyme [Kofleriaceae bacterium]|jgi:isopenicillin-N epimerase|nr:aminotransferase class V-fold PLP-dependent enzyme [Kofleriaceae bacterium]MBP6836457.1 aminotransferase class V-fold PLP-dependent enzyme [Kofleriaceae bacterium]